MKLGKLLWKKIEGIQGYAYISDSVENMDDEEVLDIARAALFFAKKVVSTLEMFITKYGG